MKKQYSKDFACIENNISELNEIMNEYIYSDLLEAIYCINICSKGKSFTREEHNIKKSWTTAVVRTVLLAILSFVVGLILKAIF